MYFNPNGFLGRLGLADVLCFTSRERDRTLAFG